MVRARRGAVRRGAKAAERAGRGARDAGRGTRGGRGGQGRARLSASSPALAAPRAAQWLHTPRRPRND